MRTFTVLFAALALAACGGSDSKTADAKPAGIDAANGTPDAPGGTPDAAAATVTGLGQVCTANTECTAAGTSVCAALSQGAANGFCTLSCGTSTVSGTTHTPPTGGDAMCAAAYSGTTGTPGCVIYQTAGTTDTWYCAVGCGTLQGQDLGGCPGGLTCTDNLCQ